MKPLLLLLYICLYLTGHSQHQTPAQRRLLTENSISPTIIYGDTIPRLNLEKQMAALGIKGVSIAVIKDYRIDWAKGYGWASEEEKIPVTVHTRFQAASISKSLNSMALLKLVQEHKLDLDADINTYLKSWKFPYDSLSKNRKITLRHLLSHTAGLTVHGFRGYEQGEPLPKVLQILNGEKPANSAPIRSQFAPSERYQYSGGGTTITQLLVTDITGMPYDQYILKHVLQPLGMTQSFYTQPPPAGTKDLATGYYSNGQAVKGKYHIYPEQAAAGLWTTPTDLAKYIIETQLEYEGRSSKVLTQEMMRKRMTFYIDSSAALGVFLARKGGETWFNHNGANEGFVCNSFGSLKGGNGVVIMMNSDNYNFLSSILNSVALSYGWKDFYTPEFRKKIAVPKDIQELYVGTYLLGTRDSLKVFFCDESVCITQNNQPAGGFKLIFSSNASASIQEIPNVSVAFIRNQEGKIDELDVIEGNVTHKCKRVR